MTLLATALITLATTLAFAATYALVIAMLGERLADLAAAFSGSAGQRRRIQATGVVAGVAGTSRRFNLA